MSGFGNFLKSPAGQIFTWPSMMWGGVENDPILGGVYNADKQQDMQDAIKAAANKYGDYQKRGNAAHLQSMQNVLGLFQPANKMLGQMYGQDAMQDFSKLGDPFSGSQMPSAAPAPAGGTGLSQNTTAHGISGILGAVDQTHPAAAGGLGSAWNANLSPDANAHGVSSALGAMGGGTHSSALGGGGFASKPVGSALGGTSQGLSSAPPSSTLSSTQVNPALTANSSRSIGSILARM